MEFTRPRRRWDQFNGCLRPGVQSHRRRGWPRVPLPTTSALNEFLSGLVITADADLTFVWDYSSSPGQAYLRQYRINFAPTFASSFIFSVPENSAANTAVGTVQAADIDPGQLTYTLLGDSPFGINATTGR